MLTVMSRGLRCGERSSAYRPGHFYKIQRINPASIIDDSHPGQTNTASDFFHGPLNALLSKIHGLLWSVRSCMFKQYNCLSVDSKAEELITFCVYVPVFEVSVDVADR